MQKNLTFCLVGQNNLLDIDYENETIDEIVEKIEYAIEQHPSFLKVIPQEIIQEKNQEDRLRQWNY
jgi:hypothetical protein